MDIERWCKIKVAILTDSSFDGRVSNYKDLYVIPLLITTTDGQTFYDNQDLTKEQFYRLLEKEPLKTSQTTPGDMFKLWDALLESYDQIIFLPISSELSGQYNTFKILSESESKYKNKVFVCNSKAVSVIQQEMINKVVLWIKQEKTCSEIVKLVEKASKDFVAFIIPKNLETLKNGGRIKPAAAAIAKMLKIIPILRYDGSIDKQTTSRTFKKAVKDALNLIINEIENVKQIDISYSKIDQQYLDIIDESAKDAGLSIRIKSELTNVIAAHTGVETVALVAWKK
ncbi:DegV family protein [Mycoplasma putrefaciens]|uniref:DegV family protein n=1 Tax=Mycoplasma putrefaciens (strain ATCC 15718 / NCTC 10155 / C30 KS-1 / KS-1) TaxID=743965 RepID=A0A7U4E979_MYCPK|nr:DegV family protein [Mycoplasma putrefaciens]AEM68584.1 DegV family protein [Mycoplasma putrefaciens KS1]